MDHVIGKGGAGVPASVHRCATKCDATSGCKNKASGTGSVGDFSDVPCFCGSSSETYDPQEVCGDVELCKDICDASKDCYGFLAGRDSSNRCFLVRSDCQLQLLQGDLTPSDSFDYHAKMDPESRGGDEACPMGVAVVAHNIADLAGTCDLMDATEEQYDPPADVEGVVTSYQGTTDNGRTCSSVKWHDASGCGWVVTVPKPEAAVDPADPPCTCENQLEAANWIFGNPEDAFHADFDPEICDETEPWIREGYCNNALWSALCPRTCSIGCDACNSPDVDTVPEDWLPTDLAAAAEVVVQMLDLSAAPGDECAVLTGAPNNMCSDPVVGLICLSTCGDRRLGTETTRAEREAVRHQYAHAFTARMGAIAEEARAKPRRTSGHDTIDIYATFDPTSRHDRCSGADRWANPPSANSEMLSRQGGQIYNLFEFAKPAFPPIHVECREQEAVFVTAPKHFCQNNNMRIDQGEQSVDVPPNVKDQTCWNKCLAEGTLASRDDPANFCLGAEPSFNQYSNALCLPREACEDLCGQTPGCVGIEVHRYLPRCYLVESACGEGQRIASEEYDLVTVEAGLVSYQTNTHQICANSIMNTARTAADILAETGFDGSLECGPKEVCADRDVCEDICTAAGSGCAGFTITAGKGPKTCRFLPVPNNVAGAGKNKYCWSGLPNYGGNPNFFSGNPTVNTHDTDKHFISKRRVGMTLEKPFELACVMVADDVDFHRHQDCGYGDNYAFCFVDGPDPSTALRRIVYANQDRYNGGEGKGPNAYTGVNRKCDGWVFQVWDDEASSYVDVYSTFPYNIAATNPDQCDCDTTDPARSCSPGGTLRGADYPYIMYNWRPQLVEQANLGLKCMSYPSCGTLTTCVLSKNRFENEFALQFTNGRGSNVVPEENRKRWIGNSGKGEVEEFVDATKFKPKTLVTVQRAVAFVAKEKWQFGAELYRNVPGHTRISLSKNANGEFSSADYAIITLASAGPQSSGELGVSYAQQPDHEPWYTDIIRVERFPPPGKGGKGGADDRMEVYAPTAKNMVFFKFRQDGSMAEVQVTESSGRPGWWSLTVDEDADYVGTTIKPCSSQLPVVDNAVPSARVCHTTDHGDSCPVQCEVGYVRSGSYSCDKGSWMAPTCALPAAYRPEIALFRLSHRSRLDYGWRIKKISLYEKADCSGTALRDVVKVDASSSPSRTGFSADPLAVAGGEWWSKHLNINPYEVDVTHTNVVNVDFRVGEKNGQVSTKDVQCAKVESVATVEGNPNGAPRQYYPREMTLHRGWQGYEFSSGTYKEDGATSSNSEVAVDGWTDFWAATTDSDDVQSGIHTATFQTMCGKPGTQIFGELLKVVEGVGSACYCKQLCIDHIDQGCRSWKLFVGSGTAAQACYLQKDIKKATDTCENAENWISGDTGLRLSGLSASGGSVGGKGETVVAAGTAFALTVNGVNLPTEAAASLGGTTPPRQRVKIVANGASCAEGEVAGTVEGIGCSHPYFCAPRPSATSIDMAKWEGLTVHAVDDDASTGYTVCYNRGFTYDRYQWYAVPGQLAVSEAATTWQTDPAEVTRTTTSFDLTVDLGAFSPQNAGNLRLKIVRSYFSCEGVKTDTSKIQLAADAAPTDNGDGTVTWAGITIYDTANEKFAEVGEYKVCFGKPQGPSHAYEVIPFKGGKQVFFSLAAEEGDSDHPRKVFSHQTLSGGIGQEQTFSLKGHNLYGVSYSKIQFAAQGANCAGATFTASVDESQSDASTYVYTGGDLSAYEPGVYDVCHCDGTGGAAGTGSTFVAADGGAAMDGRVCTSAGLGQTESWSGKGDDETIDAIPLGDVDAAFQDHACSRKCAKGCTDALCFCEAFLPEHYVTSETPSTHAQPLCLDVTRCRDACAATTGCVGFDFDPESNFCWLAKQGANQGALDTTCIQQSGVQDAPAFKEGMQMWVRVPLNAACGTAAEFTKVGTVALGERASVGNNWVLTPDAPAGRNSQGIEVTGAKLAWMTDRVLVIDSSGTCGISGPTASVTGAARSQHHFNHWLATRPSSFSDPPSDGGEVYTPPAGEAPVIQWATVSGKYCAANNMPLEAGTMAARHQCYGKCTLNAPCESSSAPTQEAEEKTLFVRTTCPLTCGVCTATTAAPTTAAPPCADDDASMIAVAAGVGQTITTCAEMAAYCTDTQLGIGPTVAATCPVTCSTCPQAGGGGGGGGAACADDDATMIAAAAAVGGTIAGCADVAEACVATGEDDNDCNCEGQMQGWDNADSTALCLNREQCQKLCQNMEDCWGIDMHKTLPRCFLNTNGCKATMNPNGQPPYVDHADYDFLHKYTPERRSRRLLPAEDRGESWGQILRFKDISFATGGQFKVCFCDKDTLAADAYCRSAADYKIDIGTVHVSGVSCLIKDAKFQRGNCVPHFGDDMGLRCYDGAVPALDIPKVAEPETTIVNRQEEEDVAQLSSWCLYGPEEETEAACQ